MKDIVITGTIAFDYLMTFPGKFAENILPDCLDQISLSFLVHEMTRHQGGTGANIAYTLALLGERPKLVAPVGQDFDDYRHWLDETGVDTSTVRQYDDLYTASFFAGTDETNCQIAFFYTGAIDRAPELTLQDAVGGKADIVCVGASHMDAMMNYVRECKDLGIPYIFDPSQQLARFSSDELREGASGAYILAVNTYEYELLREKTGLTEKDIAQAAEAVVVTRGKEGTTILAEGHKIDIPIAPPRQVADPTGAGDAFRGGLIKGLSQGWSWELSGRIAALAATCTIEGRGPQSHRFTPDEFVNRFREAFPDFDDEGALDTMRPEK